jgi:2-iminobutanoate/2-iminopropanoate deaminase
MSPASRPVPNCSFFSGQVGNRPDGVVPAGIEEQAQEAFANIARLLKAEGLTPANIVKQTIFLVHGQDRMAVRSARERHFEGAEPASTLVFVSQLTEPKYLIEVEAVACR